MDAGTGGDAHCSSDGASVVTSTSDVDGRATSTDSLTDKKDSVDGAGAGAGSGAGAGAGAGTTVFLSRDERERR